MSRISGLAALALLLLGHAVAQAGDGAAAAPFLLAQGPPPPGACNPAIQACGVPPPPPANAMPPAAGAPCQENTIPVVIAGKKVQAVARTARKARRSWQITQQTPGLPQQVYSVAPPAMSPATPPPGGPPPGTPPPGPPGAATCRDYTIPVVIDGRTVLAKGHACLQPNGSWRVTQKTPGLPTQVYVVPPPAMPPPGYPNPDPYASQYPYPYPPPVYDPWFYGPPFWFGGFLYVQNFHRFGPHYGPYGGPHGGPHGGGPYGGHFHHGHR